MFTKKEILEVKHEECVLPWNKENCQNLHGRKQLCLRFTEGGYNQWRQQIQNTRGEIDPVGSEWLAKVSWTPEKLHLAEFYQAPTRQQFGNGQSSNVIVQIKTYVGPTTTTRTIPKSAKSPAKQLLHKSPIHPPKSIKDRLKNLSLIKPEQLKQKSQAPISQAWKIQMNNKVNEEKPGSAFKMPSRTKSPIRIKQCNAQGSTKNL